MVDPVIAFRDLQELLHSAGPRPELADEMNLFGQFIGSWQLECNFCGSGAQQSPMEGELRFGWVLGGRAIQDVWIVPGRDHPEEGKAPGFHGSTIRFYDETIRAWRSTWIDPPNGRVLRFIGRPDGPDIELISDEQHPALRWRFTDITSDSFTWTGERSIEGEGWTRQLWMLAVRIMPAEQVEQPRAVSPARCQWL